MCEILKFISLEHYKKESKKLKDGENKTVYQDTQVKITLMKIGKKVYNIITEYGETPIEDIASNLLLVQA